MRPRQKKSIEIEKIGYPPIEKALVVMHHKCLFTDD